MLCELKIASNSQAGKAGRSVTFPMMSGLQSGEMSNRISLHSEGGNPAGRGDGPHPTWRIFFIRKPQMKGKKRGACAPPSSPKGLKLRDFLHIGEGRAFVEAVGYHDSRDIAHHHGGRPRAGAVLAEGFTETTEADVAPLADVECATLGNVEPNRLAAGRVVHTRYLPDVLVVNGPGHIEDGLATVSLAGVYLGHDSVVLALRDGSEVGAHRCGCGCGKELIGIKGHDIYSGFRFQFPGAECNRECIASHNGQVVKVLRNYCIGFSDAGN